VPGAAEDFHAYAVEWEPGEIRWYVDGIQTYVRNRETTPWLDEAFSRPFFLRLNLAVGGTFPGPPDARTAFPAEYLVDAVRVSARVPAGETAPASVP
jgi:beta-glucanase (GH16 family)